MLAPGGIVLPLGITAEAERISTGTGSDGAISTPAHGQTGSNPANLGGDFTNGIDTGFNDPAQPFGLAEDSTRIFSTRRGRIDEGSTSACRDSIGFRVSFDTPVPVDYFYGVDLDGLEWKTSFGYRADGTLVIPAHVLPAVTELATTTETVDQTAWQASLPGVIAPSSLPITARINANSGGGKDPGDHQHQVIYDYNEEPLTEIIFLFGENQDIAEGSRGDNNSGLSPLFLNVPEFDVGKGATASAIKPDGTTDVTYSVNVLNSGRIELINISLEDTLSFPARIVTPPALTTSTSNANSSGIAANTSWTGVAPNTNLLTSSSNSLVANDFFEVEFTINVDASLFQVSNTASASAEAVGFVGVFATDASDADTDPDGNPDTTPNVPGGLGEPTILDLPPHVSLDASKTVGMFDASGNASYAIPGSDVVYSISVTNSGSSPTDTDSMEIIDNMPPEISFWNGDIDFGGPDNFSDTTPVALEQSSGAGLTFDYNTDVRFGFGGTAPADFDSCTALAPDNTYRDDVKFICLNPKGALNGGDPTPTFSVNFRARIN